MSKLTNLNNLDKLSKALDARCKELVDEEKARAIAEEQLLQSENNNIKDMFGGKSIRYVTQAEYDNMTEDEKNSGTVTYFITDAVDLSHEHENKEFLDSLSQEALDNKVNKEDESLNTEDKTIVGAINELNIECIKAVDFDGTSDIIDPVYKTELTPFDFGAVGDGITDDTEAFRMYIDSLNNEDHMECMFIPPNYSFKANITVSRNKLTICGGGTIIGKIIIEFDEVTHANIYIEDITIQQNPNNQDNCIELQNVFNLYINNVKFNYGNAGIYIRPLGHKHSGYIRINNCNFSFNNYNLYSPGIDSGTGYELADVLVSDCHSYSTQISGIHLVGIDGISIVNNTFFFGSYTIQEPTKTNNIYIRKSNFVIIQGNNLFEAGAEAIKMEEYKNANISVNNIAWSNQRLLGASIYLTGTNQGVVSEFVNTTVNDNNINCPVQYGILVDSYVTGLNIINNTIVFASGNIYYYGEEEFDISDRRSIKTTNVVKEHCLISNNLYPNSIDDIYVPSGLVKGVKVRNNFSSKGLINKGHTVKSITANEGENIIVDYQDETLQGYDVIALSGAGSINLKCFGQGEVFDYQKIIVINYCPSTTLTMGKIIGTSTNIEVPRLKEYMYYAGTWFEL